MQDDQTPAAGAELPIGTEIVYDREDSGCFISNETETVYLQPGQTLLVSDEFGRHTVSRALAARLIEDHACKVVSVPQAEPENLGPDPQAQPEEAKEDMKSEDMKSEDQTQAEEVKSEAPPAEEEAPKG